MSTQSNGISELYTVLLDTVKGVKNGTIEVEKAKAVAELSQVIVNTGKLECEFLKITEKQNSKFLDDSSTDKPAIPPKREDVEETLKAIEKERKSPVFASQIEGK